MILLPAMNTVLPPIESCCVSLSTLLRLGGKYYDGPIALLIYYIHIISVLFVGLIQNPIVSLNFTLLL